MARRPLSKQPIPENAKRVFQGKIFAVYQWEQKLFDGTKTIFEKIKRPDTVNVFPVTNKGKIILSKQRQPGDQPFVGCLGGRIDKNETPLQAAKRELLEEGGFKAKKFILWEASHLLEKIDWVIYNFIAKDLIKVDKTITDPGEKIELFSVTFDQFLKIITQDNFRDIEIALKLLKIKENPNELEKVRQFFEG
ncbi:MAG TPA: NUDIX hydrolase [Candidatus Bathyarchaeia archaeon]|nr:NUDIX hydrolase [Candidatus Bathyarchaeia archaeon]